MVPEDPSCPFLTPYFTLNAAPNGNSIVSHLGQSYNTQRFLIYQHSPTGAVKYALCVLS